MLNKFLQSRFIAVFVILVLFLVEIVVFLGFPQIFQVSEGREGVVVNAILETRNYILPLRHAELVPSKPPLFHWIASIFADLFIKFNEFELRLPSAVAGIALIYYYYFFCLKFFSKRFSIISSLLLFCNYGFVRMSSDGRVDMLFNFFYTVSILTWIKAYIKSYILNTEKKELPLKVYTVVSIFIGFSILAKGPLGAVLPIMIISAALIFLHRIEGIKSLVNYRWVWTFIVSCPWYVAASFSGKNAFIERQIVFENFSRFVGAEGITIKPWWFYLQHYWIQLFPLSIISVYILFIEISKFVRLKITKTILEGEQKEKNEVVDFIFKFTNIWIVLLFVFLSISAGKRSSYLLLIAVPLNLSLSIYFSNLRKNLLIFEQGNEKQGRVLCYFLKFFWIIGLLIPLISFLVVSLNFYQYLPKNRLFLFFEAIKFCVSGYEIPLIATYVFFFIFGVYSILSVSKKKSSILFYVSSFFLFAYSFSFLLNMGMAVKGITHGYKAFAQEFLSSVPANEKVTFIKKKRDESFDGFFFYVKRTIYLFEPSGKEDENATPKELGLYLARKQWLNEQAESFYSRVEVLKTGGRLVDTEDKKIVLFRLGETKSPAPTAVENNQVQDFSQP